MSLRLKESVNPEELKKYGFKTGEEWATQGERCLEDLGRANQQHWYHKFLMDADDPEHILYTDEDYDIPVVSISIRIGKNFKNDMYISCSPSCSYQVSGSELDVITDTIFELTSAGLLEQYDSE